MSGRAFSIICDQCGTSIEMVEVSYGTWEAYDSSGKHYCSSTQTQITNNGWSLNNLGHRFSCTMNCWWCGEAVYYHTNGNGDSVLFDELGPPWPIHPCWEENKKQQNKMVKTFERLLRDYGYNGRDIRMDLISGQEFTTIIFNAPDHRILDNALLNLCDFLNDKYITYVGPLPLPIKTRNEQIQYNRVIKIPSALFHLFVNIDMPTSINMEFR